MSVRQRLVGAAVAASVAAGLLGMPAGMVHARQQATEAAELLADSGVRVVEDGFVPPEPDCVVIAVMMPLFAADTVGPPTPREAVLLHVARPGIEADVEPSMVATMIGRVQVGERHETWALAHAGGAVTTLSVRPAPRGGWIVGGSETCSPPPA